MLNSKFELYAIDEEEFQIEYLKKRVNDMEFNIERVNYSTEKFPSNSFNNHTFAGIILSNILHFLDFNQIKEFINNLKSYITNDTVIVIVVHSWKHYTNKKNTSSFKHYFKKNDFYKLFAKSEYEYLYFSETEAVDNDDSNNFVKEWVKQVKIQEGITNPKQIEIAQRSYLNNKRHNSMTLVIKRK